jgi:hypothetical protein
MKRVIQTTAAASLAAAAFVFAPGASAQSHVIVRTVPTPPYVEHGPERYAFNDYGYERGRHRGCRAPAWDPNTRYAPGQAVWRDGKLYVATEVSADVYNVNSPPEWTPNYWVRARCR